MKPRSTEQTLFFSLFQNLLGSMIGINDTVLLILWATNTKIMFGCKNK